MDNDLNINNYSLADTVKLFKAPIDFTHEHYYKAKDHLTKIIAAYQSTSADICQFYQKCFKIMECIYEYRKKKRSNDSRYTYDENEENIICFKIKKVSTFELMDTKELLDDVTKPPPQPKASPELFVQPPPSTTEKLTYVTPGNNMAGVLNPLSRKTITKVLNIDTRFRSNYDSSPSTDFHVTLPMRFEKITEMKLLDFEMPTTFFILSDANKNNYMWLKIVYYNTPTKSELIEYYYVDIPSGNYSHQGLITKMNDELTCLHIPIRFSSDISCNYSGSGKTHIQILKDRSTGNKVIQSFEIKWDGISTPREQKGLMNKDKAIKLYNQINHYDLQLGLGWMLGFRKNIYTGEECYLSEGIYDAYGPRYLYLSIDDYNYNVNDNFYAAFKENILNKSIIARISLSGKYFTRMNDSCTYTSVPRVFFGPVTIQKLRIRLLNELGNPIDINHMDYSFTLSLQSLYDKQN